MRELSFGLLEPHYSVSKEPHYVIEMAFDDAATDIVYFTSHSDTAVPPVSTVYASTIKKISSTSQKISPEKGHSTIGSISVELVDVGGDLTTLFKAKDIAGIGLRQRRVRVFAGFAGLDWSELQANPIQTQIIDGLDEEKGFYRLRCADIQRVTRKTIFEPAKTRLSQTIDSSQLTIPVLSVSDHNLVDHGSSYTDAPNASVLYIKIEDEVIRCTGTTIDPVLGLSFVADKRGALNTLTAIHIVEAEDTDDRGQEVAEFVYLEMPAVKMAYALLTGELLGQDGATLPPNWHLGVDTQFVRLSDFDAIGIDLYDPTTDTGFIVRFAGEKSQDGKRFIETQLLLLMGCFSPIYSDGAIGLKRTSNVLYQSPYVFELNEDNVASHSDLKVDMRGVRNLLSVQWNYDFIRDKLTRQKILVDDVSRSKHKDAPAQSLSFKGLHGSRHTSTTLDGLFDRLRDRYAGPPLRLRLKCLPHTSIIEVGDVVRVRLRGITDYQLGGAIDRSMEVQSVSINWDDGSVSLDLLGSSEGATPLASRAGGLDAVLPDSWYISAGTDLATYPGITLSVTGGVGHITAGTINGGDTLEEGRFYYNGDLEIDAGAKVFVAKNVMLAVKGFLQINGELNGTGGGEAGGSDVPDDNSSGSGVMYGWNLGVSGYIGPTVGAGSVIPRILTNLSIADGISYAAIGGSTAGQYQTAPFLNVEYELDNINGLPDSITGTGGTSGRWISLVNIVGPYSNNGGAGGAGGAGIAIVSRGADFGAAGKIITSGDPGEVGTQATTQNNHWGGSGGGGAPGACFFLLDGPLSIPPTLNGVVAKFGETPIPAGSFQMTGVTGNSNTNNQYTFYDGYGVNPPDLSGFNGGARIQFIPPSIDSAEDKPEIFNGFYELPTLSNLQLISGTATLLASIDGSYQERIKAAWNVTNDEYADGYEVQYREVGGDWQTIAVIVDIESPLAFISVTEGVTYQVRVRAYSNRTTVTVSPWLPSSDHFAQGKSVPPASPTGFAVAIQSDTGAVFNVDTHPDLDFKRFLFFQGATFSTAVFLFDASSVKSLSAPIATAESLTFWVVAEDRTGNLSLPVSSVASVNNPVSVVPALSYAGADVLLQWSIPVTTFSIDYYEVLILGVVVSASKSTSFQTRVTWIAQQTVSIVSVDIAGNRSLPVDVIVNPSLSSAPVLIAVKTAANQFKLVYSAVAGDLPISSYVVSVGGLISPTEVLEKAGTSTFTTISEEVGGDYNYYVQARDTAGNISPAGAITVRLEDSTDLSLLLNDSQSLVSFSGFRTNILDDKNRLILPIPDGRTLQDLHAGYASVQAKISAGFPEFLQPAAATATYVYTVDVGAVIAQATVQVLVSLEPLVGIVVPIVALEQSDDNVTYTSVSTLNGAGQAVAFRYIRATVTFTPAANTDFAKLLEISTAILTIAREESGSFVSTALAGGDSVPLDQPFADIQSIIATANNFDQIDASFSWIDPNPSEFKAQIFDKGTTNRYLGTVGYTAKGI